MIDAMSLGIWADCIPLTVPIYGLQTDRLDEPSAFTRYQWFPSKGCMRRWLTDPISPSTFTTMHFPTEAMLDNNDDDDDGEDDMNTRSQKACIIVLNILKNP